MQIPRTEPVRDQLGVVRKDIDRLGVYSENRACSVERRAAPRRPASYEQEPKAQEGDERVEGDGRPRFIDPGAPRRYPPAGSPSNFPIFFNPFCLIKKRYRRALLH